MQKSREDQFIHSVHQMLVILAVRTEENFICQTWEWINSVCSKAFSLNESKMTFNEEHFNKLIEKLESFKKTTPEIENLKKYLKSAKVSVIRNQKIRDYLLPE